MGRPAKSVYAKCGNDSKDLIESRKDVEDSLRGDVMSIASPPDYISDIAKSYYDKLFDMLKDSKIIGALDGPLLTETANVMAHLSIDNKRMDEAYSNNLDDKTLSLIRSRISNLQRSFFRCCNELCLSPQARSKLSIALTAEAENSNSWLDECEDLFDTQ